MASPPSLGRNTRLPRVIPWTDLNQGRKWAEDLLRALENQFGIGGGTANNAVGSGRFSPISLTQGINIIQPVSYPYTATVTDLIILVDSSLARTINLPNASLGFIASVKDATGNANSNNITIQAAAGEFIDGGNTFTMNTDYQGVQILGTALAGFEWVIF